MRSQFLGFCRTPNGTIGPVRVKQPNPNPELGFSSARFGFKLKFRTELSHHYAHDIKPQNKWATKKEIIKAIMGAMKLEHPSKEDVQEIIESHQAKRNTRTA
ncbi:hypothetical protein EDB83DRAFT_2528270 [Lactarius deliciosus]|nr:hypothetical protein EDB83DRAFT_2528270 [Lactarius deliciosus]